MQPAGATGGCACGAVRFRVIGVPARVGLCHCFDCRRHHGAPFAGFAIFPAAAVTFAGEAPRAHRSSADGHRHFCGRCGSPLFASYAGMDEIELVLGAFDAVGAFTPTYEAWTVHREPWLPPFAGLRQHERNRTDPG
jgi:hypothetical protein